MCLETDSCRLGTAGALGGGGGARDVGSASRACEVPGSSSSDSEPGLGDATFKGACARSVSAS
jgi:hypothetical protein